MSAIPTTQVTALTSFRWEGVSYREGETLDLPETKVAEFKRLQLVAEADELADKTDKIAARRRTKPLRGAHATKVEDMTTANTGLKPDAEETK